MRSFTNISLTIDVRYKQSRLELYGKQCCERVRNKFVSFRFLKFFFANFSPNTNRQVARVSTWTWEPSWTLGFSVQFYKLFFFPLSLIQRQLEPDFTNFPRPSAPPLLYVINEFVLLQLCTVDTILFEPNDSNHLWDQRTSLWQMKCSAQIIIIVIINMNLNNNNIFSKKKK